MSEPPTRRGMDEPLLLTGPALEELLERMRRIKQAPGRPRAIVGGTALRLPHIPRKED